MSRWTVLVVEVLEEEVREEEVRETPVDEAPIAPDFRLPRVTALDDHLLNDSSLLA